MVLTGNLSWSSEWRREREMAVAFGFDSTSMGWSSGGWFTSGRGPKCLPGPCGARRGHGGAWEASQ
jgi:hypothetical protein